MMANLTFRLRYRLASSFGLILLLVSSSSMAGDLEQTATEGLCSGDVATRPLVLAGDGVEAGIRWPQGAGGADADREWKVPWEGEP